MEALARTHRAQVYLAKEKVVVGLAATVGFCAVAALGLLGLHSGNVKILSSIAAIGGSFLGVAGFSMMTIGIANLISAQQEEQPTWYSTPNPDYDPNFLEEPTFK